MNEEMKDSFLSSPEEQRACCLELASSQGIGGQLEGPLPTERDRGALEVFRKSAAGTVGAPLSEQSRNGLGAANLHVGLGSLYCHSPSSHGDPVPGAWVSELLPLPLCAHSLRREGGVLDQSSGARRRPQGWEVSQSPYLHSYTQFNCR